MMISGTESQDQLDRRGIRSESLRLCRHPFELLANLCRLLGEIHQAQLQGAIQIGPRPAEIRIQGDSLPKQRCRLAQILVALRGGKLSGLQELVVRIQIGRATLRARHVANAERHAQCGRHLCGDLLLHCEDVLELTIERSGPDVYPIAAVDQLGRNP